MLSKAVVIVAALLLPVPHAVAQDAPPEGWAMVWDDRPSVRYGELFRVDLRARVVSDMRRSGARFEEGETGRFDIPRRRIGVSGEIARVGDFQIERELVDTPGWRDVYLNYRGLQAVEIQGGQFKLPFGLDENTSSTSLDFVYRSRAAALSPGRDPGVMAHGRVGRMRFAAGIFSRDGDNGRRDWSPRLSGGVAAAGRLIVEPFRSAESAFENFQAGVALTSSNAGADTIDFRGATALGQPAFRPEFGLQGPRTRLGLELRWRPGPFSLQSEWVRLAAARRGQSIEDTDLPSLTAAAWYLQGTWVLTGEDKGDADDEPKRPLFGGGFGSVELAARLEAVRFSSGRVVTVEEVLATGPRAEALAPHRDRTMTLGVNWSPNRWIRLQANAVRDTMTGESGPIWSRVLRLRFAM